MTDKQLETIKLFALGYNTYDIAKRLGVSQSSIRQRLRAIKKSEPNVFSNACGVRNSYKRSKENLEHPMSIDEVPYI